SLILALLMWREGEEDGSLCECPLIARGKGAMNEHKKKAHPYSHTARYNIDQLVYYETFETINEVIARESTIKNMHRIEKVQLIVAMNPDWADLSVAWDKPA